VLCGIGSCGVPGKLCHGDGDHEWGARRRRALMLPILLASQRAGRQAGGGVAFLTVVVNGPQSLGEG
jgi:hypothetical protein